MNTNHDASYLLISVLLLALSFSGTALGQSNNLDSLIPLNGIEGKFEVLTDGIFPNKKPHFGKGLLPLPDYYNRGGKYRLIGV